jgi:hypothetical protein
VSRDRVARTTGDRRGAVGAQREVPAALVGEVVELLADGVGRGAELLHDLDVLEDRRDDEREARSARTRRERGDERLPAFGFRRQDVVRAQRLAKDVSVAGHARAC